MRAVMLVRKLQVVPVTDGNLFSSKTRQRIALNRLAEANKPMYLVSLSEQMKRITSDEAPGRYRSKQFT